MAQKSVNNINDLLNSYQLTSYIIDTVIYKGNRHTMPAMNKVLLAEWAGTLRLITCQSRALKGSVKSCASHVRQKQGVVPCFGHVTITGLLLQGHTLLGWFPVSPLLSERPLLVLPFTPPCLSHWLTPAAHTAVDALTRPILKLLGARFVLAGTVEQKWLPVLTTIPTFLSTS